jgi:hypothetical protein
VGTSPEVEFVVARAFAAIAEVDHGDVAQPAGRLLEIDSITPDST